MRTMRAWLFALSLVACKDDAVRPPPVVLAPDASVEAGAPPLPSLPYAIAAREVGPDVVAPVREQYALPSLSVLVFQKGAVIAEGAVGLRKLGDPTLATRADAWFLGDALQPMTATLAALFVQRGTLGWDTKLSTLSIPMDASYKDVTLEQLIAQRGGVVDALPDVARTGDPRALRANAIQTILSTPASAIGVYRESASSFLVANAILEAKTGRAWEDLVESELFGPLGMSTCAYVAADKTTAYPWGHAFDELAQRTTSFEPGLAPEASRALAPAGGLRCGLEDWGRFAALHLRGARAEAAPLLSTASFAKLHTPIDVTHALGWEAISRTFAGETLALTYRSRQASSYAVIWLLPDKDTAILAATNQAGSAAEKALDDVVLDLVAKFVPPT